jgi:hypothetical protein
MRRRFRFQAGDSVRVRSKEEIRQSLNDLSRTDGCLFMEGMWRYCGGEARIIKPVIFAYDEHLGEMRRTRMPLYVLESAICDGSSGEPELRCDRTCYFLWHEAWLEKTTE